MDFDNNKTQSNNITYNKALKEIKKEEETLLAIRVPEGLHTKLKTKAAQDNNSIKKILTSLIKSYLDNKITI
jgi:predicted HicB family RNase H-like nuclease